MERKKKHGIIRRGIAIILSIVLTMVGIDFGQVVSVKAETDYTTLYFIDDTKEQWISNNHAVMKAIDNSNQHNSYWMTQVDDATWSVKVPKSAYNITFNRYKSDKTTQWNSWSAGGRDGNNAYYAEGSEYGHWGVKKEAGFQEGDIIYLDVSEFTEWENNKAIMYVNFTDASKENNGGKNIVMSSADNMIYNP